MKLKYLFLMVMVRIWNFFEMVFVRLLKLFKKPVLTTYGDFYKKYLSDSKKVLIREICNVTGLINNSPGNIDKDFYAELRGMGKKSLLKALCMLMIAYTKKIQGHKENTNS